MFTRSYRKAKTDNGSEYLKQGKKGRKSNFTHIVEDIFKSEQILIPPLNTMEGLRAFMGVSFMMLRRSKTRRICFQRAQLICFILPIILDEHIGLIMELNKLKNENLSCNYDILIMTALPTTPFI